jgi:hypothetical protein
MFHRVSTSFVSPLAATLAQVRRPGLVALGFALLWTLSAHAATTKMTATFDGITFDSAYDNGSLAGLSRRAANDYDATLYTDSGEKGTAKYWFRFTMTGVAGRTVTLHLDHSQNPVPFLRILDPGPGAWRRMTSAEAPSSSTTTLTLTFASGTRAVELAFFEPLGYAETVAAVTTLVSNSPYATMASIGKSFENRDLHMVTVENPRYPTSGKYTVWVHARVHAGEVTATHTMLGFLSQVLEDSETGRQLREHVVFHIVPQVNADGIYRGHTRWDSQGIDPEAEWCNIRIPEVAALKTQVDALMESPNPISVALNLHSTVGNYTDAFFWKHLSPSVTTAFENIEQRYIDAVNAATPLFDNRSPQTSQLNACTFIESYFWNNWGESVMAMTQEGHFYRRITDNAWVDGAHYREIGRAEARALVAYYNLPATAEPDLTYAAWQAARFTAAEIANPAISSLSADPDHDALANLWEYVFGLDPKTPSPWPIHNSQSGGNFTMAFDRNQHLTDVKLALEHSSDLLNWTREDLATSANLAVHVVPDVPRGPSFVDETTVTHHSASVSRYYRLVAIKTP